ncbi:pseudouridine synthase [Ralstonia pickettii]|jgi:23S rRNA pseudouridine2604 synthase|nr:pseudouridine synthase [Ralstonia insidiosa]MBX3770789.1 pseudouridine synthase [Ralstonia pickettii]MBA9910998.1 pseudouridine synthase [Ralstonia insidiosa]MBA9950483.1 pseudouridine synthase [Ralstonia insidiosa]MBA9966994.1 pseudouridine synthase [Ralstonia insidiosa]
MTTDSDDFPSDDDKRRSDPTQRATRPGKRTTLGVRRDDEGNTVRSTGKPLRASDLNRDRLPLRPSQRRPEPAEGERKPRPPRRDGNNDTAQPPRRAQSDRPPRRFDDERPPRKFGDDQRPPRRFEDRPPRRFDDERPPRRFSDDQRPPRRSDDERPPRRFEDRPPRRFDDERPPRRFEDRPPRRFDDERPPRKFGDDQRAPRRFEDRPPRRFDDERPRRYGDDQRAQRRDGDQRPPRRFDDERPPRRFDDEQRPSRRYGDDRAPRRFDNDRPPRRFEERSQRPEREERAPRRTEEEAPRQAPQADESGLVRLSKRMSELGLCSRREADEWIPRGWVLVDGEPVTELGSRVKPDAIIEIHQAARSEQGERVTVLLHKPVGYVSGQAEDGYQPAAALFVPENQWEEDPTRKRFAPWQRKALAPAGRLDIDSTGLLVLTQDGRVARHLIGEDSTVEKEYLVRVVWDSPEGRVEHDISKVFPEELLEKLRFGLWLDDEELKPAKVSWQNEEQLRFVLREGKKRQIRRMCEQVGLEVVGLKRIRMGRIVLGDLPVGQWRFLGPFEKF